MDPVQNLSIKIKKYPWTWSMTGGPWNRSKVGVQGKSDIHGQEENGLELFISRRHFEENKQSKTLNQAQ